MLNPVTADSVKQIFNDFADTCCAGSPPETVAFYKHVFFAAFEACLLCVMAAPFRFAGDGEKVAAFLAEFMKETEAYFADLEEQRGSSTRHT